MDQREYRKLKATYYQKLKDTGFRDIEDEQGRLIDHQNIVDFSQRVNFRSEIFEGVRGYYYWASSMLHRTRFKTRVDRRIWELHSEGVSSRKIEAAIKRDQTWICRRIKKIREYLTVLYRLQAEVEIEEDGSSR